MEKAILILVIIILLIVIGILILCSITFMKVKNLQQGNCVGVPKFDPNSVYTKTMTIPIVGYKMVGTATFKPDNTFVLNFSGDNYPNNKWIYNSDTCSLTVSIDPSLQDTLVKYNSSIDNTVQMNRRGQLIVNGIIEGLIPIQVTLDKK
jgi:hypothetical protein